MYDHKLNWDFCSRVGCLTIGAAATYAALYFAIGEPFAPPDGQCFAVVLVWLCAHIGGFLAVKLRMPALLGMLLSGVLLQNVPGDILRGYPHSWMSAFKAAGLATILMRAGLKVDYAKAYREAPIFTLSIGMLPCVCEAFLDSAVFTTVYGMPYLLAATAGFLLAALSPTIMVTGMIDLQQQGLGEKRGVPGLLMAASGLDVIVGLVGYSIFISLAIPDESVSYAWSIARGPMGVVFGIVAGFMIAGLMGCTKLWNRPLRAALTLFFVGQMFMFLFYNYSIGAGAGALSSILGAGIAGLFWAAGFPRLLSNGPQRHLRKDVDAIFAVFWLIVVQPLLFGTIGASVVFSDIQASTIPKALLVIAVGSIVRMLLAWLLTFLVDFTWKERLFIALAWIPKATVQGALSSDPLDRIEENMSGDAQYEEYVKYGNQILATAIISIAITAPIGLLVLSKLGPKLLTCDGDTPDKKDRRDKTDEEAAVSDLTDVPPAPPLPGGEIRKGAHAALSTARQQDLQRRSGRERSSARDWHNRVLTGAMGVEIEQYFSHVDASTQTDHHLCANVSFDGGPVAAGKPLSRGYRSANAIASLEHVEEGMGQASTSGSEQ